MIPTRFILAAAIAVTLAGCGSTPPTKIGADTYYSSATNSAGIFGDVSNVAGKLMVQANEFCAAQQREVQMVSENTTSNIPAVRLGGASITFKCVEHAGEVHMRPDNGVTTVTQ